MSTELERDTERDDRRSAHDLLLTALENGQPLSVEVRDGLSAVLTALSLSEDGHWRDLAPDASFEDREQAMQWHASGWHVAVAKYRSLLHTVRVSGVSGTREGAVR